MASAQRLKLNCNMEIVSEVLQWCLKIECKSKRELGHCILLFKIHKVINVCFPNMPKGILSHCFDPVENSLTTVHSALFMFEKDNAEKENAI